MREIGGYIELDRYALPMLHEGAVALNCGRNGLAYLVRARRIKKMAIPKFLCGSVSSVCEREGVEIRLYSTGMDFMPTDTALDPEEWLYVVNYYGQLGNDVLENLAGKYGRIIVDNAQAYFQMPLEGVDTIYTCRKFFGVADGAFLYTDAMIEEELPRDESFERMRFLLGRFERTASEFYPEYAANNGLFAEEPIKKMSRLTENLLHGIDYGETKRRRTENFACLHEALQKMNRLQLSVADGAFMYPLYIEGGARIRRELQKDGIYVPMLWPDVLAVCEKGELEHDMADNILPLPVDQRYCIEDMEYLAQEVLRCIG